HREDVDPVDLGAVPLERGRGSPRPSREQRDVEGRGHVREPMPWGPCTTARRRRYPGSSRPGQPRPTHPLPEECPTWLPSATSVRSEERRVGKECGSRWAEEH